jgi:hypothetical protein
MPHVITLSRNGFLENRRTGQKSITKYYRLLNMKQLTVSLTGRKQNKGYVGILLRSLRLSQSAASVAEHGIVESCLYLKGAPEFRK